ncbi:sialate O-acetylesterase [Puniceicoccus vermicola]|uniref:Sialate O-acetylesterase n=1 Tax=Puniceicoccus vermicola TaxID=388746 RepID=A0A7X1B0L0_9BACT|nr:sialate O-acetylesterase [Puniceicoccus vermicola]MBC2603428.1 sialate O-acetylesterase [Puniceicoccus vermicola]
MNIKKVIVITSALSTWFSAAMAEVSLPNIFSDHMVLQRSQENPVWGKARIGESVTVRIQEQIHETVAGEDGKWRIFLNPMEAGGPYQLTVSGEENELTFSDVLVGEVWFCSGQSNMQWAVGNSNDADVEVATANYPEIRLLTIPMVGRQEPQENFEGEWKVCSPESVKWFSAVGYFFGRRLHNALEVPVGLIDNSWGGSAAEAWIPRDVLQEDPEYSEYLAEWDERIHGYTDEIHAEKKAAYQAWVDSGKPEPKQTAPRDQRHTQHRPGNIYYGMLYPTLGYGIRGVIWYQGETNATRPESYTDLMTKLIHNWRLAWGQGEFPFYWVQLADFKEEATAPEDHEWSYLREAQTRTLDNLDHVGQAVAIDVGEGRDIHPRNKQVVANRLARLALANDYGFAMASQSPRYSEAVFKDGYAEVRFDFISKGLYAFDTSEVNGFTIAGADMKFVNAEAEIISKDTVKIWSSEVPEPVAVRYAWAANPDCNLYDRIGLPVTPFRTDSQPAR